jgi:hypothetical protein
MRSDLPGKLTWNEEFDYQILPCDAKPCKGRAHSFAFHPVFSREMIGISETMSSTKRGLFESRHDEPGYDESLSTTEKSETLISESMILIMD